MPRPKTSVNEIYGMKGSSKAAKHIILTNATLQCLTKLLQCFLLSACADHISALTLSYHYDFRNDASLPRRPSATKFRWRSNDGRWRSNDGRWRSNDGRWRAVTPTLQAHCLPEQAFCTLNL